MDDSIEIVNEVLVRIAAGDFSARVERTYDGSPFDVLAFMINATAQEVGELFAKAREHDHRVAQLAAERLDDRLSAIGTLSAGVAHELNNPLTFVASNLAMLREDLAAAIRSGDLARAQELLGVIDDTRTGIERMISIVRDLRALATSSDSQKIVDPAEVVGMSVKMTRQAVPTHAVVECTSTPTPPVNVSESRLGQVIVNLVRNAIQAVSDQADGRVRVHSEPGADGMIAITVADNGVGIEAANLGRIFDAFYTTREPGEGTGLGLSISHQFIGSMGGTLSVKSRPGEGTMFTISLPAASWDDVQPIEKAPMEDVSSVVEDVGGTARILLVDDEPLIRKSLVRLLGRTYEVESTGDPREALGLILNGGAFDLVLCDLMLPDLDGRAIYEEVAEKRPEMADKMLFMTGGAYTERMREFVSTHASATLSKPIRARQLRHAVTRVLAANSTAG